MGKMYTNHQELHGDACDTMEDDNNANQPLLSESDLQSAQEVLILSLQATISNLEDKVSALRQSENAATKVVVAYKKLWDSTTQVMRGTPVRFETGTSKVETRWDKKAIKSLVAELDQLDSQQIGKSLNFALKSENIGVWV